MGSKIDPRPGHVLRCTTLGTSPPPRNRLRRPSPPRAGPAAVRTTSPASDTRAIGDDTGDVLWRRRDAAVAGPGPARAASGTEKCWCRCWQRACACMAAASGKYGDDSPSQLMYGRPRARSMLRGMIPFLAKPRASRLSSSSSPPTSPRCPYRASYRTDTTRSVASHHLEAIS